ncbi:MAG: L-asparagine permease, partial [Rhodococcus sp. (in: high G+C Gram-positive bacteria)]
LACVLVLMAFDKPVGTWTVASILLIAPMLIGGWFVCRKRIREVAARSD